MFKGTVDITSCEPPCLDLQQCPLDLCLIGGSIEIKFTVLF